MSSLGIAFMAGLLGSAHCLGMCGPFALMLGGAAANWRVNLLRQWFFTLGRMFTYSVFGAMAGFAGLYLRRSTDRLMQGAGLLAILAGVILIYEGLKAARVIPVRTRRGPGLSCLAAQFFSAFLRSPGLHQVFLAGMFTGMLPCGLVYGFLALAAGSGNPWTAALLMAAFGLGTAPVMVTTGCGGSLMTPTARRRLYAAAAWCLVATGAISIARGAGFVRFTGWVAEQGCLFCQ